MPNRVIRESLLDSDHYWSVSIEAQQLFFHLMLLADDLACVSLAPIMLRRRCFDTAPSQTKIDKLLHQLVDSGLIRRYESGDDAYAFIPKFRQRLQRSYLKCPMPPEALYSDDEHAKKLFNQIKSVSPNTTVGQMCEHGSPTAEEKRREENRREEKGSTAFVDNDKQKSAADLVKALASKHSVFKH